MESKKTIGGTDDINWISVTNDKLEEQYKKEKEEIVQSKVDTSGL